MADTNDYFIICTVGEDPETIVVSLVDRRARGGSYFVSSLTVRKPRFSFLTGRTWYEAVEKAVEVQKKKMEKLMLKRDQEIAAVDLAVHFNELLGQR